MKNFMTTLVSAIVLLAIVNCGQNGMESTGQDGQTSSSSLLGDEILLEQTGYKSTSGDRVEKVPQRTPVKSDHVEVVPRRAPVDIAETNDTADSSYDACIAKVNKKFPNYFAIAKSCHEKAKVAFVSDKKAPARSTASATRQNGKLYIKLLDECWKNSSATAEELAAVSKAYEGCAPKRIKRDLAIKPKSVKRTPEETPSTFPKSR